MKAFANNHPNIMLIWWCVLTIWFATDSVINMHGQRWGFLAISFMAFITANSRCKYWYNRTGEQS